MDDKKERYSGIMLIMKKRMVITNSDDTTKSQYTMFGHYDGLDLQSPQTWYAMRPKRVGAYGGNTSIADPYGDKHTLKGYFPRQDISADLEKHGFQYEFWKHISLQADSEKKIRIEFPFITVAVINLSKEFVENSSKKKSLLKRLCLELEKVACNEQIPMESLHCAVIPSIGYADFIVLFHSDDPSLNIRILDGLKGCNLSKPGRIKHAIVSNSYSISGVYPAGLSLLGERPRSSAKVSLQIILKEGVSAGEFRRRFEQEIRGTFPKMVEAKQKVAECFRLFGNSDCVILPDIPIELFLPLYFPGGFLNPSNAFYKAYIKGLYSSLRTSVEDETAADGPIQDVYERSRGIREKITSSYQDAFTLFIEDLEKFCEENKCPIRIVVGLQTVMKTYLNFIQSSHCFDIETIIGKAFDVLCEMVRRNMSAISDLDKKIASESDETQKASYEEDKRWQLDNMIYAISIFREKIGDYLVDLQRSDSSFMEGQSLLHPSIGSATKLLFFYNSFVNNIAQQLVDTEVEHGNGDTYTFVVTSGGCDKTNSCDVFSHLDPAVSDNRSLIILTIPEMSLYDIRGTLFRILHEALHFCGKRLRIQRAKALVESLCRYAGEVIGEMEYHSLMEDEFYENIYAAVVSSLDSVEAAAMNGAIKEIILAHCRKLCSDVQSYLMEHKDMEPYISCKVHYDSLYSLFLTEDVKEKLFRLLIPQVGCSMQTGDVSQFFPWLYFDISTHYKVMLEEVLQKFAAVGIHYSQVNILKEKADYYLSNHSKNIFDRKSYRFIQAVFHVFLGNHVRLEDGNEYVRNDITPFDDLFDSILMSMQEVYSDCIGVTLLNMTIEDFLLSFVYESWDIIHAFPNSILGTLRVGLELKLLYSVNGCLGEDQRKVIAGKCQYWEKQGFEYQIDPAVLCDWIDKQLADYNTPQYAYFMEPVETYVRQCISLFKGKKFDSIHKLYMLTSITNDAGLYKLLDEIVQTWESLAH